MARGRQGEAGWRGKTPSAWSRERERQWEAIERQGVRREEDIQRVGQRKGGGRGRTGWGKREERLLREEEAMLGRGMGGGDLGRGVGVAKSPRQNTTKIHLI